MGSNFASFTLFNPSFLLNPQQSLPKSIKHHFGREPIPREHALPRLTLFLPLVTFVIFLLAVPVRAQESLNSLSGSSSSLANAPEAPLAISPPPTAPTPRPRERSELATMSLVSIGDYRVFGATARCNVYAVAFEYDRHIWGYHYKARVDYVLEAIPIVFLSQPVTADFWGNPTSPDQQLVHGISLTPFGFRFMWRSNARVKPYMTGKMGIVVFNKKAFSPASTYANFNPQGEFGVQFHLNDRLELRLVPLEYFHASNGYLAASNPGMDELAVKFGLSYQLGRPRTR
jgi:hypothetical protein